MSGEIEYRYCMEACVEYLVTIYQEKEKNAIVYCRELCASHRKPKMPASMIAVIRRFGSRIIGKKSL